MKKSRKEFHIDEFRHWKDILHQKIRVGIRDNFSTIDVHEIQNAASATKMHLECLKDTNNHKEFQAEYNRMTKRYGDIIIITKNTDGTKSVVNI